VQRLLQRCLEKDARKRLRDIGDARADLDEASSPEAAQVPAATVRNRGFMMLGAGALVGAAVALAAVFGIDRLRPAAASAPTDATLQRMTDFVGVEESPSLSPDGRTIAFIAPVDGVRQVWVQLIAGGTPLQLTRDNVDHRGPRWSADSNTLVYSTAATSRDEQGTIWQIPALGGTARPVARALGAGDVSADGRRLLAFQDQAGKVVLVAVALDGSATQTLREFPGDSLYDQPRWSPDGSQVAFMSTESAEFDERIYVLSLSGGDPIVVARGADLAGFDWLPDGSGLVYASARGSTVLYPPTFNLRVVARDGTADRQITYGDTTFATPDVHPSGVVLAARLRSQSNAWRIPVDGSPADNTRRAVQITSSTSAVQTPSASPDGSEIVYLSDSGGHGNLWETRTDGSGARQITFERDPAISIGVPVWSPSGRDIAFVRTSGGVAEQWLANSDGSGARKFLNSGVWAAWSPDGHWLYHVVTKGGKLCVDKAPSDGGAAVQVRCDDAAAPTTSPDGSTLYFATPLRRGALGWDWELRSARPEGGPSQVLARIVGTRVPLDFLNVQAIPSPDGRWLGIPLSDGGTTNMWIQPSEGGELRPVTAFNRPVVIARRFSWAPDSKSVFVAVGELDADIVRLEGVLR
jgi:Tol biopolymer transport system component